MAETKVSNWLTQQYLDWQKQVGRRTIGEFAEYINVPQTSLSAWMNGKFLPKGKNLSNISEKLGYGIYDVMGLSRPLSSDDENFPPKLRAILEEIKAAILESGVVGDSPEAERITSEIMAKHGFKFIEAIDDNSSE